MAGMPSAGVGAAAAARSKDKMYGEAEVPPDPVAALKFFVTNMARCSTKFMSHAFRIQSELREAGGQAAQVRRVARAHRCDAWHEGQGACVANGAADAPDDGEERRLRDAVHEEVVVVRTSAQPAQAHGQAQLGWQAVGEAVAAAPTRRVHNKVANLGE